MSHAHTYISIYFESNINVWQWQKSVLFNLDQTKHKRRHARVVYVNAPVSTCECIWCKIRTYVRAWSYITASIYGVSIFKNTSRYKSHELCRYLFVVWFISDSFFFSFCFFHIFSFLSTQSSMLTALNFNFSARFTDIYIALCATIAALENLHRLAK